MLKFIKKLMVRFRKKEKKYEPKDTHFGEIETNALSAFVVDDPEVDPRTFSNFILYQEANYDDDESIAELKSFQTLLNTIDCKNVMISGSMGTILVVSGSLSDYNALKNIYDNDYNYAYHKHIKHMINFLYAYHILISDLESYDTEFLRERLKFSSSSYPVEIHFCDPHDIYITDTVSKGWQYIIDKYHMSNEVFLLLFPLLKVYYNAANIGFEESSDEYLVYNIESLSKFMYHYTHVFDKCVRGRIDELYSLVPDEFRIDVLNKNIFELNLFSNPLDQSSAYDDVDEIID